MRGQHRVQGDALGRVVLHEPSEPGGPGLEPRVAGQHHAGSYERRHAETGHPLPHGCGWLRAGCQGRCSVGSRDSYRVAERKAGLLPIFTGFSDLPRSGSPRAATGTHLPGGQQLVLASHMHVSFVPATWAPNEMDCGLVRPQLVTSAAEQSGRAGGGGLRGGVVLVEVTTQKKHHPSPAVLSPRTDPDPRAGSFPCHPVPPCAPAK